MFSIILPVFNEEARIEKTLDSLFAQEIVENYPNDVEVLVIDSLSTDNTVRLASRYPVGILSAPRGKLRARTVGIHNAKGDIIVACDGDSIYPPKWLHYLTRHFINPQVVAVSGPRLYLDALLINVVTLPYNLLCRPYHFMSGSNSAFRRVAFFQVGGFREVNESNVDEVIAEEEIAFGDRLAQVGRYVFDFQAIHYTSARRFFETRHNAERLRGERF